MSYVKKIILFWLFTINSSFAQIPDLNEDERVWISEHPVIRIAFDKQSPPFEWQDKSGKYQGISIEIIELIEKQLDIKFQQIEIKNWSELLKEFKAGKIDVIPAIAENIERQNFLLFTKAYSSIQGVIISDKQYNNVNELMGKKVGVVSDYIWDELVSQYDDQIHIIRVETTQAGIELAAVGAIDAMVSDLASVSYHISAMGISNLHVVPVKDSQKQRKELAIGIRKDWPKLQAILQKALNNLKQQDKDRIHNKWIKLHSISFWQSRQFWLMTLLVSTVIMLIVILILIWNRSLKLQVARRTEQLKKAQRQLIHAEKMESIGRLSAGVAHEVKNPLAILQMSIDYLKGEDNDETIVTILDDMDDAIVRADTVIKGLLDFSREKELQVIKGNINEVIKKSLKLIEHEAKQHKVKLSINLSSDLPELNMDKNRLQQVFINLFMNAIQAIGNSGEISVQSKVCEITEPWVIEKSEGLFSLHQKVIDIKILVTGCGLDKNNVFEPFFTTKPVGEGTGLGLSVSKTIIGLHRGMITMKNRTDDVQQGVEVKLLFSINGE
ncbi:MAG: transporter substrate-binding domain-containing protein [gamma proteobacterium symbiont of Lucinoma myriamae]|nr:transporter substrate-binding domain-containing protein [gamma proteobacterium symbiont of Lucinoma myriamae]MCU7818245.1 transporter substrate-binding domain-containing protein [gamma proteobacterium symbiont of Lucinoma myriamae]